MRVKILVPHRESDERDTCVSYIWKEVQMSAILPVGTFVDIDEPDQWDDMDTLDCGLSVEETRWSVNEPDLVVIETSIAHHVMSRDLFRDEMKKRGWNEGWA